MDRKEFIRTCGLVCLGSTAIITWLQSCTTIKILSGNIAGDDLILQLIDFDKSSGNEKYYRKFIIVQNDILQYPICVFRFNENEYSALWMQCTHQGTELQVFGDKLQCPAHGSEFDNRGGLQNGPADKPLRSFPVSIESHQLKISLKAI